ncbi:hypothetical protein KIPB_009691, partial [Kipferlia bialata]
SYIAKRGGHRASINLKFLQATQKYRENVVERGADATRLAFTLYSQYLHSDQGIPAVHVSKSALDSAMSNLTSLSVTNTRYSEGETNLAAEVFTAVETEVLDYLERHTMAEFYQSRYYVLVDVLSRICHSSTRVDRNFLRDYFSLFHKKGTFVHPLSALSKEPKTRREKAKEREREMAATITAPDLGLPLASILGTLGDLVQSEVLLHCLEFIIDQ